MRNNAIKSQVIEVAPSRMSRFAWWFLVLFAAIILASLCRIFIFQTFDISSSSMSPTLLPGDRVLVSKLSYGISLPGQVERILSSSKPRLGEIVVFKKRISFESSVRTFVKRVVAVPGDSVELREGLLLINGRNYLGDFRSLVEKREGQLSIQHDNRDSVNKLLTASDPTEFNLAADEYFVLGDNFLNSEDSRYFGPISLDEIVGRVKFIYWSSDPRSELSAVRWERIFRKVL